MTWAEHKNVSGIFSPKINDKRVFMDASMKTVFHMEAEGQEESIAVGKYLFSKNSFLKAEKILQAAAEHKSTEWLIIDEIGPLELKGKGFCNVLKGILQVQHSFKIVLVVRAQLTEDVKTFFDLTETLVFKPD